MLQKVTRLDSVPTADETVLTTEVPKKESRLYTLLDWADNQACSLLQYINVIVKLFIMGNYFSELR